MCAGERDIESDREREGEPEREGERERWWVDERRGGTGCGTQQNQVQHCVIYRRCYTVH